MIVLVFRQSMPECLDKIQNVSYTIIIEKTALLYNKEILT